jgi:hypothetical protein
MKSTGGTPIGKRLCYCDSLSVEWKAKQGLPEGYCGICERCGKPGHMQHFPGPIPYTGAWCDRCVRIVAYTWPLKHPSVILILVIAAIVLIRSMNK